ncbi:DUF4400 domain-containing protein [Neisseria yangbaofengii]|uniref:DUF4400 domain-containing protein n=1 Tax=Neisseria yangbaofengii TaxID=2709396 RepID=UPI001F14CDBF|nr:DUF4400 domain-containing protein [Neisseria yangbaofengii]
MKFLLSPFKAIYTVFLILLIIFGLSLATQNYLQAPDLLEQELSRLKAINQDQATLWQHRPSEQLNTTVARTSYRTLSTVFFEWSQINKALSAQSESDEGYQFKNYLIPRLDLLKHFDKTLQVISIRIGNICLFIGLAALLYILALIDGLVMRRIRQENASRESAGIYHRAKYWRSGIIWLSILFYLCSPIVLSPYWLLVPILSSTYMVFLQAKYLKKYL